MHANIYYIHTYIHTYITTCKLILHTYIHTYIHSHIHSHIHTHIHYLKRVRVRHDGVTDKLQLPLQFKVVLGYRLCARARALVVLVVRGPGAVGVLAPEQLLPVLNEPGIPVVCRRPQAQKVFLEALDLVSQRLYGDSSLDL